MSKKEANDFCDKLSINTCIIKKIMNNSAIILGIKAFNLSLDEKCLLQEKNH